MDFSSNTTKICFGLTFLLSACASQNEMPSKANHAANGDNVFVSLSHGTKVNWRNIILRAKPHNNHDQTKVEFEFTESTSLQSIEITDRFGKRMIIPKEHVAKIQNISFDHTFLIDGDKGEFIELTVFYQANLATDCKLEQNDSYKSILKYDMLTFTYFDNGDFDWEPTMACER